MDPATFEIVVAVVIILLGPLFIVGSIKWMEILTGYAPLARRYGVERYSGSAIALDNGGVGWVQRTNMGAIDILDDGLLIQSGLPMHADLLIPWEQLSLSRDKGWLVFEVAEPEAKISVRPVVVEEVLERMGGVAMAASTLATLDAGEVATGLRKEAPAGETVARRRPQRETE